MTESHTQVILKFDGYVLASREGWQFMLHVVQREREGSHHVLVVFPSLENDRETFAQLIEEASRVTSVQHKQKLISQHETNKSANNEQEEYEEDSFYDGFLDWLDKIFQLAASLGLQETINNKLWEEGNNGNVPNDDVKRIFELMRLIQQLLLGVALMNETSDKVLARLLSNSSEIIARLAVIYFQALFVPADKVSASEASFAMTTAIATNTPQLNADIGTALICAQLKQAGISCSVKFYGYSWGVFTSHVPANKPFEGARLVKEMSYEEALEIAASNSHASLQANALRILHENKIDAVILSSKLYDVDEMCREGTRISYTVSTDKSSRITCICLRSRIILISIDSLEMWKRIGFLGDVFSLFKRYHLSVDFVTTSESNITLTLDIDANELDYDKLGKLLEEIRGMNCRVETKTPCTAISLIGRKVANHLGNALNLLNELSTHDQPTVYLISQSASDVNLTLIVNQSEADRVAQKMHDKIFNGTSSDHFGPIFGDLLKKQDQSCELGKSVEQHSETLVNNVSGSHVWWRRKREKLLELMSQQQPPQPLYVYDEEHLRQRVRTVFNEFSIGLGAQVFYAMKANSYPEILRVFEEMGLGFECVSLNEIQLVLDLFPNIDPNRILFTPNFAPRHEYERALALNVRITLDNMYPMQNWHNLFRGKKIMIRVDPGVGKGHHAKVKTAGKQSKFGVHVSDMEWLANKCREYGVIVEGLHAHLGSGILNDFASWSETAEFLSNLGEKLFGDTVQYIDCGGGLGVPQRPNDPVLDLQQVCKSLATFRDKHPDIKLMIEPGRYMVAESGVLLANVTQVKSKDDKYFVGLDTGMNSLIRPALYGAYHDIVNLTHIENVDRQIWNDVDVVGPICESGDILGYSRTLMACDGGDIVAIATAGAYGYSMSSNYNLRSGAKQVMLPQ